MTTPRTGLDEQLGRYYDAAGFVEATARYRSLSAAEANQPANQFVAASAAVRLGDLATGSDLAERSLAAFHRQGDPVGIMCATNLLGAIDFEQGRIDRASHRFEAAQEMARRLGDTAMVARTINNLANIAHLRGQSSRSLHLYRRAIAAMTATGDIVGAAETWHNLSLRLRQLGAFRDAAHAAERALDFAGRSGRPSLIALCQLGRADMRLEHEDFEGARGDLIEAEPLVRCSADPFLGLEARRLSALLTLRTGLVSQAVVEATVLVTAAARAHSALLVAEGTAILALALKAAGDVGAAERERAKAIASFVRLGASDLKDRFEIEWDDETGPLPDLAPSRRLADG
ncbi:MAG: tetratricopeptide repeat protein [Gemmatimonadetes bacterium]|nr:tetratricopeptide repeat protein [Gemmatimonadota bacterium]